MRELASDAAASAELLDLGCGVGRSLVASMARFDAKGIGLELNRQKVATAQEQGLDVFRANILDLDPADFPNTAYVTMDNVLEHLPSLDAVAEVVTKACRLAHRLVYIRHPSFEDEEYLAGLGLKQYWTDWPGAHTTHIRLHEFVQMANAAGCYRIDIRPVLRATGADDSTMLPLDAPPNQRKLDRAGFGAYDPDKHGPKPDVGFDRPVYFAFDVFLVTGAGSPEIRYDRDPEHHAVRPSVRWSPDPHAPDAGRRRRTREIVRSLRPSQAAGTPAQG